MRDLTFTSEILPDMAMRGSCMMGIVRVEIPQNVLGHRNTKGPGLDFIIF